MKKYSIGKFAEEIGVTIESVRNWDRTGKLKPAFRNPSGHRYYTQEQVDLYLGLHKSDIEHEKITIGYCRVSSPKQKDDLERQVENMKTYLISQGKPYQIITDIGSGLNYRRRGLDEMIDLVLSRKVDKIVILYKDRLLRFGYELLEDLFARFGTTIEIVVNTEKTENEELVEDLIQIITVFSARLQGKRAHKAKKMIEELKSDDSNKENQTKTN